MIEAPVRPIETEPVETVKEITPTDIIEALKRGRQIRPLQGKNALFRDDGRACALGAIALGFGYSGDTSDKSFSLNDPICYSFLYDLLGREGQRGKRLVDAIFMRNDSVPEGQGDAAVLEYLRALEAERI